MRCCGCNQEFPEANGPTHAYMLSSPGCWAAFGELLVREYSDPAYRRVHRLSVDAYALQHPGVDTPQSRNSVGVHFSRLSLLLGRGWPIERANDAMVAITAKKMDYPWLVPPASRGELSLKHVLLAEGPSDHCIAVEQWALSVWQAWTEYHPTVDGWLRRIPR